MIIYLHSIFPNTYTSIECIQFIYWAAIVTDIDTNRFDPIIAVTSMLKSVSVFHAMLHIMRKC